MKYGNNLKIPFIYLFINQLYNIQILNIKYFYNLIF